MTRAPFTLNPKSKVTVYKFGHTCAANADGAAACSAWTLLDASREPG